METKLIQDADTPLIQKLQTIGEERGIHAAQEATRKALESMSDDARKQFVYSICLAVSEVERRVQEAFTGRPSMPN